PLLRLVQHPYELKGFSADQLQKLVPEDQQATLLPFIERYTEDSPWATQLLQEILAANRDLVNQQVIPEIILRQLFDMIIGDRLDRDPELKEVLFAVASQRQDGFTAKDELLPQGDTTLIKLMNSSFIDFNQQTKRYFVVSVLARFFHPRNISDNPDIDSPNPIMPSEDIKVRLRDILMTLINDQSTLKTLLDECGIRYQEIDLQGNLRDVWNRTINYAILHRQLPKLVKRIQDWFPNNEQIRILYAAYTKQYGELEATDETQILSIEQIREVKEWLDTVGGMWPLRLSEDLPFSYVRDANHNFPQNEAQWSESGEKLVYQVIQYSEKDTTLLQPSRSLSAESLCRHYLLRQSHHILLGNKSAGKSWLRLYLEKYASITNAESPCIFFFAPLSLQFNLDELNFAICLARSVAFALYLKILMDASAQKARRSPIAPFLQKYGYDLLGSDESLVDPLPPIVNLGIDQVFGNDPIHSQMTRRMKTAIYKSDELSFISVLDDIQKVLRSHGYQWLIVLIDNWEFVASTARSDLLTKFLSDSALHELSQRGIYLKVFVPPLPRDTINKFQKECDIERISDSSRTHLTLYSHL
ncbi:MAG TPA: effector-associated domain EAD1-containing protein, partial [Nitrosomonas sp.]|nr:effector-associated domain EAD1-containing protein [Nitrosomonas sp.]